MDDFVSKPVQLASLEEGLLRWLPHRALDSVPESLSACEGGVAPGVGVAARAGGSGEAKLPRTAFTWG